MISRVSHILRLFLAGLPLWLVLQVNAQDVPWAVAVSSATNSAKVVISSKPTLDGVAISESDYIGVFDSLGNCFGLEQWRDTSNFYVKVNGSTDGKNGMVNGSRYQFKLWIKAENCIAEQRSNVSITDTLLYKDNSTIELKSLSFIRLKVKYATTSICANTDTVIMPSTNFLPRNLNFYTQQNIEVNSANGFIHVRNNLPGIYTIYTSAGNICESEKSHILTINEIPAITKVPDTLICPGETLQISLPPNSYKSIVWYNGVNTENISISDGAQISYKVTNQYGCANSDTFEVKKSQLKTLQFETQNADCNQKGKLTITQQEVVNGKAPYTYSLKNILDNTETTNTEDIPEGIYELSVMCANGCKLKSNEKLVLQKDCLNDIPVFTPNSDGKDDRYFINLEGKIRIYDRSGKLRRSLTGPVYFDGKDDNGNALSMGTYLITTEKGKTITLTIIK